LFGQRIYLVGGFVKGSQSSASIEYFDLVAKGFGRAPDLPVAVNHASAVATTGALFVFGGYRDSDTAKPTDRVFAFKDEKWSELPRMPEARAAAGAALLGDQIYIAGGVGPNGLAASMLVFDPLSYKWRKEAGLLKPREHLGAAAARGKLYAVGGRAPFILSDVEEFDPSLRRWRSLPPLPTARGGLGVTATATGFVLGIGGQAPGKTFSQVEAFDVENGKWITLPPLPVARHGAGVVSVGDSVHVIDGGPQAGFTYSDIHEALDMATLRPGRPEKGKR